MAGPKVVEARPEGVSQNFGGGFGGAILSPYDGKGHCHGNHRTLQ